VSRLVLKSRRSRLLMPSRASAAPGRAPARRDRGPPPAHPAPYCCAAARQLLQLRRSRAATISRIASAPIAARLGHLVGVDGEILAQHRQAQAARASRRIILTALKKIPIRQHGQAGGAAGLVLRRRSAPDRNSSRITPLLGEAFFTSAITAASPPATRGLHRRRETARAARSPDRPPAVDSERGDGARRSPRPCAPGCFCSTSGSAALTRPSPRA
jgi:hypothetical protein